MLKILSFGSRRTREEPHAEPAFPDQQYGDQGYADPGYPEQHYLEQQQPYPGEPYADQGGDPYPPQQWHNGHPQPGTALELAGGIGEEPLDAEGWLTVHHVKKSYKKRMVVRGREPRGRARRIRRPARPQRRRQDDRVLHDHRAGARR